MLTREAHGRAVRALAGRWLPAVAAGPAARAAGGDFACSPAGLWLALAAVAAGARGRTARELRELVGTAGPEAAAAVTGAARALAGTDAVRAATGVWSRAPVLADYRAALPDVGFGPLGDRASIDAWVREATGGLVAALPLDVTAATRLLVVDALVLKARWAEPFPAAQTAPRAFRDARDAVRQVPTMHRTVPRAGVWTTADGATVVELPCAAAADGAPGARVRFVLGADGAPAAEVLPAAWSPARAAEDADAARVAVALPRLSLRTTTDVAGHFGALGLREAVGAAADFSGLSRESLRVEAVAQECVLAVAELGVEAAAATAARMSRRAAPARPPLLVAFDRPFGVVVLPADGDVPLFAAWQAAAPAGPEPAA